MLVPCTGWLMNMYDAIDLNLNLNSSINAETNLLVNCYLEGSNWCVVECLKGSHGRRVDPFGECAKRWGHEFERNVYSFLPFLHSFNIPYSNTGKNKVYAVSSMRIQRQLIVPVRRDRVRQHPPMPFRSSSCPTRKMFWWEIKLVVVFSPNGIFMYRP